ncbi:hypothetical protein KIPB_011208, partial [Kipferlia bialata]
EKKAAEARTGRMWDTDNELPSNSNSVARVGRQDVGIESIYLSPTCPDPLHRMYQAALPPALSALVNLVRHGDPNQPKDKSASQTGRDLHMEGAGIGVNDTDMADNMDISMSDVPKGVDTPDMGNNDMGMGMDDMMDMDLGGMGDLGDTPQQVDSVHFSPWEGARDRDSGMVDPSMTQQTTLMPDQSTIIGRPTRTKRGKKRSKKVYDVSHIAPIVTKEGGIERDFISVAKDIINAPVPGAEREREPEANSEDEESSLRRGAVGQLFIAMLSHIAREHARTTAPGYVAEEDEAERVVLMSAADSETQTARVVCHVLE